MGTFVYVCPHCGAESDFQESPRVQGSAFMPTKVKYAWHSCGTVERVARRTLSVIDPTDDNFLGGIFRW